MKSPGPRPAMKSYYNRIHVLRVQALTRAANSPSKPKRRKRFRFDGPNVGQSITSATLLRKMQAFASKHGVTTDDVVIESNGYSMHLYLYAPEPDHSYFDRLATYEQEVKAVAGYLADVKKLEQWKSDKAAYEREQFEKEEARKKHLAEVAEKQGLSPKELERKEKEKRTKEAAKRMAIKSVIPELKREILLDAEALSLVLDEVMGDEEFVAKLKEIRKAAARR